MSLTHKCDMFLETPCLPEAIRYLPKACVMIVLQVCYLCVMSVLQLFYECVTIVLWVCYEWVRNVLQVCYTCVMSVLWVFYKWVKSVLRALQVCCKCYKGSGVMCHLSQVTCQVSGSWIFDKIFFQSNSDTLRVLIVKLNYILSSLNCNQVWEFWQLDILTIFTL